MKIIVLTNLYPNKAEPNRGIFIKHQVTALSKICDVKVIAPVSFYSGLLKNKKHPDFPGVSFDKIDGVEVLYPKYFYTPKIFRALYGFFMFFSVLPLCKKLSKTYSPDIYISYWLYPDGFATTLLGKFFKKPFITNALGCDLNHYTTYYFRRKMIGYATKNADLNLILGKQMRPKLKCLGVPDEKILDVFNGVRKDKFFPVDKNEARKKLKLDFNSPIIIFIGRFSEEKGVKNLIAALGKLSNTDVKLILIGEGHLRGDLEKQVDALGLKNRVRFTGLIKQDELPLWINASDLLCLPSLREGWPNVIMESLACGTPVVASNVGAIPEIISCDKYGYLAEPNKQEELAKQLDMALNKKWNKESVSKNPLIKTWDELAQMLFNLFSKIVSEAEGVKNKN